MNPYEAPQSDEPDRPSVEPGQPFKLLMSLVLSIATMLLIMSLLTA